MKTFIIENDNFALTLGEDALAKSLIYKKTGEELLSFDEDISIFSLTQLRPFNNEVKLAYLNKRTTFAANKIEKNGDTFTVSFEIIPCKAIVGYEIGEKYISFTLKDFVFPKDAYGNNCMDLPPVEEFGLLSLPIKHRKFFGQWINAIWDENASAAIIAATPEILIDSQKHRNFRTLTATAKKEIKLIDTTATLIVSGGREDFLDAVDSVERRYSLPLGVESRRSPIINRSIYWSDRISPANIDEHIKYAKMGGFECMLLYYECMCPYVYPDWSYGTCADYSFNEAYPRGAEDLKEVVAKIKAAGITPGLHFLHTHVGNLTKYITPVCDGRLNLVEHYTLAEPIGLGEEDIYVYENPKNALMHRKRRVLQFGGELISYEGFTDTPPYKFYGIKRGYWKTNVTEHSKGERGGILDISEYAGSSAYINQNTDLQDEVAEQIANIYDYGFEFIYFDGSEGTNTPYEYHVPNAQYRVIKKLKNAPKFCEGAAKAHFGWHHLSGANAFDIFPTDIFKAMIDEHPLKEAAHMAEDFTRINFGWWAFYEDTRRDVYEYGTSHAFAWNSPITIQCKLDPFKAHARTSDILEVIRRWEYARKNNLFADKKEDLKIPGKEHTIFINENGEYELIPYAQVKDAFGKSSDMTAFVFERENRAYALIWHNKDKAEVEISLSDARYEREIGKPISICEKDGVFTVPVSDAAYLSTTMDIESLKKSLENAKII